METEQADWTEDIGKLQGALAAAEAETNKDKAHSYFYAFLRYARPTSSGFGNSVAASSDLPSVRTIEAFSTITQQLGFNVTAEVTDACTAKICQRLRPKTTPVAAKTDIERQCTLLNRVQDGVIDSCDFFSHATRAWEDVYSFPNGYVFFEVDEQAREIKARRFDPRHVFFLGEEGANPVHLYAKEAMSKSVLVAMFPDMKTEIMGAKKWTPERIPGVTKPTSGSADTVCVVRAWKRRLGEEPGRYVVMVDGHVLNGEKKEGKKTGQKWDYDFFPFAVFRGRYDFQGFGGIPLGRITAPYHMRINKLTRMIDDSFIGAIPIVWSHKLSKLDELSNIPYQIGKYEGNVPPRVEQMNPVSSQALEERQNEYQRCYEALGINRSIAQGQAPRGVTAGTAIREVIGLADARAAEYQKHWESGWRQAGHIIVAFASALKKLHVRSTDPNSDLMEELDLTEIKLNRHDYRISFGLTSALSQSIHGLISDLTELKDLGTVDTIAVARVIGTKIPDVQAEVDRITAAHRLAEKQVQDALDRGIIPVPPSGKMQGQDGIATLILKCRQEWCNASINPKRYRKKNMEVLRKLLRVAESIHAGPAPAQQTVTPGEAIAPNAIQTIGTPVTPAPAMA